MPILRPEVERLMNAANLGKNKSKDIKDLLEDAGLGLAETLQNLKETRDFTESESTRTRINEAVLKMHGVMKEEGQTIPSITILIADPNAPIVNPILLPRELHKRNSGETTVQ